MPIHTFQDVRVGAERSARPRTVNVGLRESSKDFGERRDRQLMAVSRRSDDEIHPWLLNGDLRPKVDIALAPGNVDLRNL